MASLPATVAPGCPFGRPGFAYPRLQVHEPGPTTARQRHLRHEIAEGLWIVAHDPLLRVNTLYGCVSNMVLIGFQSVLVVFLVKTVGLSSGVVGLLLALIGSVTVAAAIIATNIIWGSWRQSVYPAQLRGRISTSVMVFAYGVAPVGAVLAGLIASHAGVRAALWIIFGGLALSSLVMLVGPLPRLRDLPTLTNQKLGFLRKAGGGPCHWG